MNMTTAYELEKSVWIDADFDLMGWHDSFVHAFAFRPESFEFLLDIDYILQWVKPTDDDYFSFWVAPATLVFLNASEVRIDLQSFDDSIDYLGIEILGLTREPVRLRRAAGEEWRWRLDTSVGEITLRAEGYRQHFRRAPRFQRHQKLTLADRGGYSFERPDQIDSEK